MNRVVALAVLAAILLLAAILFFSRDEVGGPPQNVPARPDRAQLSS